MWYRGDNRTGTRDGGGDRNEGEDGSGDGSREEGGGEREPGNFFSSSLISIIADGPHHYHPDRGHKGSSISPRFTPYNFLSQCKFSTLTISQPVVGFYLRSHAFRYERKNTDLTLVRIELTTSALAGVTY